MKKIWIPALLLSFLATSCGGNEAKDTSENKAQICKEGDTEIPCDLKDGIANLRKSLNNLPHFATDTIAIDTLIEQYNQLLANNQSTIDAIKANDKLAAQLAALTESFENSRQFIDSLSFKRSVMEQLEAGTNDNHYVVSLSAGKQKHPIVFLRNKSKKYFHTATFHLKLVTRDKQVLKELIWIQNTAGFEPAAFGAVFPPYFKGENKTIPLYEKLSESEIAAWDSTELKLINITW
jgi:hypothetical protein